MFISLRINVCTCTCMYAHVVRYYMYTAGSATKSIRRAAETIKVLSNIIMLSIKMLLFLRVGYTLSLHVIYDQNILYGQNMP